VIGFMAQYIPALEYYSDGKLPLVSTITDKAQALSMAEGNKQRYKP